jgi:sugar O-acyltransferase (sialic acid O-acetyltransferase NeuD family)
LDKIILFGASGHSKPILEILEQDFQVVGYIDDFSQKDSFCNYPILGKTDDLLEIVEKYKIDGGFISIGDNFTRWQIFQKIRKKVQNFKFVKAIHKKAIIGKNVEIGDGTVVMAGAVINPSSRIGEHSIINTSSVIEHDSQIGDFSTIAPKVAMGGGVQIGNFSTISIGATVKHLIKIGDDVVVGANSLVLKNLPNNIVAYGLPAKKIRERKREDKYL